jgi:predicted nucleotidyltransferase component of viral defense system
MPLKEDQSCYARIEQRELLMLLSKNTVIAENFFLTGGTALSVFFLYHRVSDDLDFFTINKVKLEDISFWIRSEWPHKHTIIRSSEYFLSLMINNIKVDFVYDPLSTQENRDLFYWENGSTLRIDTLMNIASNKLCTLVSRSEPKDLIDLYFLFLQIPELEFKTVFQYANEKETLFDDPPTAAYQIEEGVKFLKDHENLIPSLKNDFNKDDLYKFYDKLVKQIYNLI